MSGPERFVTRGRLCLASGAGADLTAGGLTNVVHQAPTRRQCGLAWSPSGSAAAAPPLAALWESTLNAEPGGGDGGDLTFSPETMERLRSPRARLRPAGDNSCNICLEELGEDRMACHGCSMVAHPRCLSRWFNGQPTNAKDAIPEPFPSALRHTPLRSLLLALAVLLLAAAIAA